jgi:hypothetical protein
MKPQPNRPSYSAASETKLGYHVDPGATDFETHQPSLSQLLLPGSVIRPPHGTVP